MSALITEVAGGWRVQYITSRSMNMTTSYMAVAPGCPTGPHPQRWCECKPHATKKAAEAYATERLAAGVS